LFSIEHLNYKYQLQKFSFEIMYNDAFLQKKLKERVDQNAFRELRLPGNKIDFCSNDYLGIVKRSMVSRLLSGSQLSMAENEYKTGSTGSRLLSGNYPLIEEVEEELATFHEADAALIFNSGYDANVGVLASVPQRGDTVIYDQLCHASIRYFIRLSFAMSFYFEKNDLEKLL
jgi:8-amino-7-oxononanoate synthase